MAKHDHDTCFITLSFDMQGSREECEKRAKEMSTDVAERWELNEVTYAIGPSVVSAQKRERTAKDAMDEAMEEEAVAPPKVH